MSSQQNAAVSPHLRESGSFVSMGEVFCCLQVLSVAQAMEWVMLDSLREEVTWS